jgi:protein-disulfide isomerase
MFAALAAVTLLAGASCGEEKKTDEEPSAESPADTNAGAATDSKKDEVSVKIYPPFDLTALKPELRARMVKLAEAELCPCEGSTDSLDACLKKADGGCMLAVSAGGKLAEGLAKGLSDTDAINGVTSYLKVVKATHDFDLKNVPLKGKADAKVVLVEFADFGCPHCRQAASVMDEVTKKYGDKIAFYYMQFPLREQTAVLSLAALAAHQQGKFWPMHDMLFKNQSSITMDKVNGFAKELGMNSDKFAKDMFSDELKAEVQRQRAAGEKAEIGGTPALFVNGKQFLGEKTLETVSKAIDAQLAAADTKDDAKADETK